MINSCIPDNDVFYKVAHRFLDTLFSDVLEHELGQIEIRVFPKAQPPRQYFFSTIDESVKKALELCNFGIDAYFGVNPRIGGRGKKENISCVTTFHVEIDYGEDGHRKKSDYKNYDEAYRAINTFSPSPSLINHSGGGFHCYWVLQTPIEVKKVGVERLENINKSLSLKLGGDQGTQDISRVLRLPGTYNFKLENNPREVTVVKDDGPAYCLDDFNDFTIPEEDSPKQSEVKDLEEATSSPVETNTDPTIDIDTLAVPEKIKSLIREGNNQTYPSRSEADMAVIVSLVSIGIRYEDIKRIFTCYPIGEKYREHSSPASYLTHSIKSAENMTGLTDEERINPLFISGAIQKKDKKLSLHVLRFQEYMTRKYRFKYLEDAKTFFRYNGTCYEYCSEESLNNMCQSELAQYRQLFTKNSLRDFIHFSIGDNFIKTEQAQQDQLRYLTLQNGLYDLEQETLRPHTPDIFTANLLPYNYDPQAQCPRFLQYLDEVFLGDMETIHFIQEAVGYIFHRTIPKPTLFFLIGSGSNGKSVFIDTITNLIGQENSCSISLNSLTNEYYLLNLFNKMLNVSSETPRKKYINTDLVKAVVGGDWVTGRLPYKPPTKFRAFAKHFFAMNEAPEIHDDSHGMWRRLYIVDFPRCFREDEMDVFLSSKLKQELSGIFNWSIEGYKRLREENFIFSQGTGMQKSKQTYKIDNNSVLSFLTECIRKATPDDAVKFKLVYDVYMQFCQSEGFKSIDSKKEFRKRLEDLGYSVTHSTKMGNSLCIHGVALSKGDIESQ
jgi:putative DNA primase/helicase